MSLRNKLAVLAPRLLDLLQRARIAPDPFDPKSTRRIGTAVEHSGYQAHHIGTYRPECPLKAPSNRPADPLGDAYALLIDQWGEDADHRVDFGYFDVPDVRMAPKFGVHWSKAGNFIESYCSDAALKNPKYELPRLALPIMPVSERLPAGILLVPAWHHNFYHWMMDIIPRLQHLSEPLAEQIPIIIPTGLSHAYRSILVQALNSLEVPDVKIVELSGSCYHFDRMVIPTRLNSPLDISPSQRAFLRHALMPEQAGAAPGERLYISRRDTNIRRIVNEQEVEAALHHRGFRTVTLSGMAFSDQIKLFADASAIVGHHGAGFVHLAFCQPGTVAVEIFQDGHFAGCFTRLAQLGQLDYGYCVGMADGIDTQVNLSQLNGVLDHAGL